MPGAMNKVSAEREALKIVEEDPYWRTMSLCQNRDPDIFFGTGVRDVNRAKKICNSCLVKPQCLAYALDTHTKFGVWGGMSYYERIRFKRRNPQITNWQEFLVPKI